MQYLDCLIGCSVCSEFNVEAIATPQDWQQKWEERSDNDDAYRRYNREFAILTYRCRACEAVHIWVGGQTHDILIGSTFLYKDSPRKV